MPGNLGPVSGVPSPSPARQCVDRPRNPRLAVSVVPRVQVRRGSLSARGGPAVAAHLRRRGAAGAESAVGGGGGPRLRAGSRGSSAERRRDGGAGRAEQARGGRAESQRLGERARNVADSVLPPTRAADVGRVTACLLVLGVLPSSALRSSHSRSACEPRFKPPALPASSWLSSGMFRTEFCRGVLYSSKSRKLPLGTGHKTCEEPSAAGCCSCSSSDDRVSDPSLYDAFVLSTFPVAPFQSFTVPYESLWRRRARLVSAEDVTAKYLRRVSARLPYSNLDVHHRIRAPSLSLPVKWTPRHFHRADRASAFPLFLCRVRPTQRRHQAQLAIVKLARSTVGMPFL
eukprot:3114775-Rhodomonas_salina.1